MKLGRQTDPKLSAGVNEIPLQCDFDYSGLFYYFLDYQPGRL